MERVNNTAATPTFMVGSVPVFGDLILSPMDGYSDLPFRMVARELGSAMSYTEFINAIDVVHTHPHLDQRLTYDPSEHPIVYQIFDDDPERLVRAAHKLRPLGPDIIDINMGCSDKRVANRGAGAGLLREPAKIASIFNQLSKSMDIPITGKIRLGWDGASLNYLEVAKIIEDNGGQLIAVHGRTKAQSYTGTANWDAIAEVKQAVSIPVIGNGDVRTPTDIDRIKAHTGCDAVMIARASISNPWIFARMEREQVPWDQVRALIFRHLELMLSFYGPEKGLIFFRKYAARYVNPYGLTVDQRKQLLTSTSAEEFLSLVDQIAQVAEQNPGSHALTSEEK